MMIADGYARATQKPALVQIHSGVGLGNAIGMLYQAKRGHAPLVVIAGDAGHQIRRRWTPRWRPTWSAMARPVTKWATMVTDPQSLLRVIRRAIKIASTPPMGPVFVCLPADVLDAPDDRARSSRPSIPVDARRARARAGSSAPPSSWPAPSGR